MTQTDFNSLKVNKNYIVNLSILDSYDVLKKISSRRLYDKDLKGESEN